MKRFFTFLLLFLFVVSPVNFFVEKIRAITTEEQNLTSVIEKISSSVVTVEIEKKRQIYKPSSAFLFNFFNVLKVQGQEKIQESEKTIRQNIGSGFIVSSSGLVVTNNHVVSDSQANYSIITKDQKKYKVVKIYRDSESEIAVLKINASNLQPVVLADSEKILVGQKAIAIGTPFGRFQNSVTVGIVSGIGREVNIKNQDGQENSEYHLANLIQTDAAINFGNSGGPLLDSSGHVIGVNTVTTSMGENIGFAIPANTVKKIVYKADRIL